MRSQKKKKSWMYACICSHACSGQDGRHARAFDVFSCARARSLLPLHARTHERTAGPGRKSGTHRARSPALRAAPIDFSSNGTRESQVAARNRHATSSLVSTASTPFRRSIDRLFSGPCVIYRRLVHSIASTTTSSKRTQSLHPYAIAKTQRLGPDTELVAKGEGTEEGSQRLTRSMAVARRTMRLALPVLVAALLLLAALGEARPLGGADWAAAGGTPLPGASTTMAQALRRLYTQRLDGPGASCTTNSPNNRCPP